MVPMEQDVKQYLAKNIFVLGQMRQIIIAHNKVFSTHAALGDIVSSSMLLNNNILLSGIETLLKDPIANEVIGEAVNEEELFGEADENADLGKLN